MAASGTDLSGRFYCEGCGRSYAWKSQLAGKKVQCRCGQVMIAPEEPVPADQAPAAAAHPPVEAPRVAAAPDDDGDLYDLKDDVAPPVPKRPVAEAPPVPVAVAAKKPVAIPYRRGLAQPEPVAHDELADQLGGSVARQIVVPAAMAVLGIATLAGLGVYDMGEESLVGVLIGTGILLAINLVLSFIAVAVAVKLFEIAIGAPGPAALKLIALAIFPQAMSLLVGRVVGFDSFFVQIMISSIVYLPLCFFGFMLLFEMDTPDAMYCTAMLYLVSYGASIMLG